MLAATHENQISHRSYCQLGGCRNSSLSAVQRANGGYRYITYHHVGGGLATWKQDLPAGPTNVGNNTNQGELHGRQDH